MSVYGIMPLFLSCSRYQCRLKLGSELLCFSKQIANGMSYLELRGFIHRDLACRNVLLNRHSICKVKQLFLCFDYCNSIYHSYKLFSYLNTVTISTNTKEINYVHLKTLKNKPSVSTRTFMLLICHLSTINL